MRGGRCEGKVRGGLCKAIKTTCEMWRCTFENACKRGYL